MTPDPPATFRQLVPALRLALDCMRREHSSLFLDARDYDRYGDALAFNLAESRRASQRRGDLIQAMNAIEDWIRQEVGDA